MSKVSNIRGYYLRCPIEEPVVNSFGRMDARQSLLVRVEDTNGCFGWGEIWCNFPPWGGAHRARLLENVIGPWYIGQAPNDPSRVTHEAYRQFHVVGIQCGEHGPFSNVIAGIDCALWDLLARKNNEPLAKMLGGELRPIPAYASGINPTNPMLQIDRARSEGYQSFKLKLGFANDEKNLDLVSSHLDAQEELFVDINQGYDQEQAFKKIPELAERGVGWIEEPIAADASLEVWQQLATKSTVPIAGGENIASFDGFMNVIATRHLGVIQPDVAKWGGLSLCKSVAQSAVRAGLRYCPHYLGGGIGLLHSAHLLTAIGGDGLLEVDCNDNPLRNELVSIPALDEGGNMRLPELAGIGAIPNTSLIEKFQQLAVSIR